jgi:acyl-CoA dehydrogenase
MLSRLSLKLREEAMPNGHISKKKMVIVAILAAIQNGHTHPLHPVGSARTTIMTTRDNEALNVIREGVRALCEQFDAAYWRKIDEEKGFPEAFVSAMTAAGWLSAMIPEQYGGSGLGLAEASVILEEVNRCGGNSGTIHGQMYNMFTLLRNGSEAQKSYYLPKLASGELRLQSMGVTEPTTGTDTTKIKTTAVRKGDRYVINGQKVWISRVQHSDLMILLARTTPLAEVKKKSEGMSIFLVDLREAIGNGLTVQPIANMVNHETNELFFDNLEIPADSLIGEEGKGFRYILDGLNAERTLIAAECIGDGRWFIEKCSQYARDRVVFGRPIGQNQGVQFPIAEAHIEIEAADLMRWQACEAYDSGKNAGASANMAKYLAAKASWEAANACLQTHGGFGFATEYDVERKFRETRLYQVAPISTNLILSYVAEHLLELPRSF